MEPNQNSQNVEPISNNDIVFRDKPKRNKGVIAGMVCLALLAIGGISFGVWAMMDGNARIEKKDEQIAELNNKLTEEAQPVSDETVVEDDGTNDVANVADYIYVGEWGIKIKIPDSLSTVSYRFSQEAGFTKVTVWGVDCSGERCQYFPDYADVNKNTSGMGSIARYQKGTTFNEGSGPALVFSDELYDYYQYHLQVAYTIDNPSDESKWEMDGVNIIDDMLSNSDNYSKF